MPLFSARGPISHQTWDQRTEDYLAVNPAWKFMFMGWDVQGFLQNLPLPHSSSCWFPCSFSSMPGRVRNQLPGLSCKHSRQAAAVFHLIFLKSSLVWGDQHCFINCFSAPARKSGELLYLHIRKSRWKNGYVCFSFSFLFETFWGFVEPLFHGI